MHVADTLCCHEHFGFHLTAAHQVIDETLLVSIGLTEAQLEELRAELPEQIEAAEAMLTG